MSTDTPAPHSVPLADGVADRYAALEHVIQRDPGNRGIAPLFKYTHGALKNAVSGLLQCEGTVAILTGFNIPPQETDGPSGALAMARALSLVGKNVVVVCGSYCYPILQAGIAVQYQDGTGAVGGSEGEKQTHTHIYGTMVLEDFGTRATAADGAVHAQQLIDRHKIQVVVSIEFVGPSIADGKLYRMSGADTTHLQGYAYTLFQETGIKYRLSIGDGGNELGCGKWRREFWEESTVPRIEQILCAETCDDLILSGVSNWGGYAIALALLVGSMGMTHTHDPSLTDHTLTERTLAWAGGSRRITNTVGVAVVLSVEGERRVLQAMVQAGAVDPRHGSVMMVDGMGFDDVHAHVIQEMVDAIS
eukprot:GDKI01023600.1.p1 GENE.GDKI01023600.1~~GDKI01023600.1.p1  ORF type:complete len:362 (-),score=109.26 GDKI01023600.1:128-1213(-)